MIKITDYNKFNRLKDNDNLSELTYFRLWIDEYFNKKYIMQTRIGESIISYQEGFFINDGFMIGKIIEIDGKNVFNLEYIHSFKKGVGTKMLLTYINKFQIKNILYLPSAEFDFWDKIKEILKNNNIIIKTPGDNIEFQ